MTVSLGQLSEDPRSVEGSVNETSTRDLYSFSLDSTSNVNLSLTDLSADADLQLAKDENGNRVIDEGEVITGAFAGGDQDDAINRADLDAGNYLAEVFNVGGGTDYTLKLSTSDPSNLLPTEVSVGSLENTQDFSGSVGNSNTADVYSFNFNPQGFDQGDAAEFELSLTGLSSDADVRLIQDTNSNSVVDSGEVIGTSSSGGSSNDSLSASLNVGADYFVQVYQYSGDTDYTLSLIA